MDSKRATELAKELLPALEEMGNWSREALFICLRDDFKCVYCGRDLLKDRDSTSDFSDGDIFNYFSHFDHLLPKSKYLALQDELTNKVLCCVPCNRRKQAWDPNEKKATRSAENSAPLGIEEQKEFMDTTRARLEPLNRKAADRFAKQKKLILERI